MLLMAGIRARDKRGGGRFWIRCPMAILYHVCSMFAICSFSAFGPRCAFGPRGGPGSSAANQKPPPPLESSTLLQATKKGVRPPPPPTQTYGDDPPRRFAYSELWADISFSNARGWAPRCSIGFRRPRRTSPMPMRPSSASPVHGFISSTSKPANFSARNDPLRQRARSDTGPSFCTVPRNGIRRSA